MPLNSFAPFYTKKKGSLSSHSFHSISLAHLNLGLNMHVLYGIKELRAAPLLAYLKRATAELLGYLKYQRCTS